MKELSFVIVLMGGEMAYVKATHFNVFDGCLVFWNSNHNVAAYAPGHWVRVAEVHPAANADDEISS